MCTLVSRHCVPFCKHLKPQVYPGVQGTQDKLNQIQISNIIVAKKISNLVDLSTQQTKLPGQGQHLQSWQDIPPLREEYPCHRLVPQSPIEIVCQLF